MGLIGKQTEQQAAVYSAESSVDPGLRFVDYDEAQAWADRLTASSWWAGVYGGVTRIDIVQMPKGENVAIGRFKSIDKSAQVGLPPTMLNEQTILHEVAHVVLEAAGYDAGHGPEWIRQLLNITYRVRGSGAYTALYTAFRSRGLDLG